MTEAQAMYAAIDAAQTLTDLDALYVSWIGYSAVADNPATTAEELHADLLDYVLEATTAAA